LLTEWPETEPLPVTLSQELTVTGLGEGQPVKAYHSWGNAISMKGIHAKNQDILVLSDHQLGLSETIGFPVYGIIGYPFFASFDVLIDYRQQQVKLFRPGTWQPRQRFQHLNLHFHRNKPYTPVSITQQDSSVVTIPLLIDLGASHALSLYTFAHPDIFLPSPALPVFLGKGLGGNLYGHIARIRKVTLGNVTLEAPIVSFPDSTSIQWLPSDTVTYHGSIGGETLRRFQVVISYAQQRMYLRPTGAVHQSFRHNTSGIEIIAPLAGYPVYLIDIVNVGSPADNCGLQPGDQLVYINGVNTATLSLQETLQALNGREGKKLRIHIIRKGRLMKYILRLQDDI
jgi:hypothetical protein